MKHKGDQLTGDDPLVASGGCVRVRPNMRKALEKTKPERLSMTQWVVTLLELGMEKGGVLPKDYRY